MLLKHLKQYLILHEKASLSQLAFEFERDPLYIKQLLSHWINKGKVVLRSADCTVSCNGCSFIVQEYHWQS